MDDRELQWIGLSILCTGSIFLITLPAVRRLARASRRAKLHGDIFLSDLYRDHDGAATEESQAEFSDKTPRITIYTSTILGFGASCASAVLSSTSRTPLFSKEAFIAVSWLNVAAWALILVQAAYIAVERSPALRFNGGILGALSAFFLLLVLLAQNGLILVRASSGGTTQEAAQLLRTHCGLSALQGGACVVALFANISLPRRPVVFTEKGIPVDNQYTTSAFVRSTLGWCLPVLVLASKRPLNIEDLPRADNSIRSRTVTEAFNSRKHKGGLLKLLLIAHYGAFLRQLMLTILKAIFRFAPQITMYNLLHLLEKRSSGENVAFEAWIWVAALGLGLMISAWLETWVTWTGVSQLVIPLRAELTALIFQKAMRRKDVKEAKRSALESAGMTSSVGVANGNGKANGQASSRDDKKSGTAKPTEEQQKTKQSTVNLISVDARQVFEMASQMRLFPDCAINLAISITFLIQLIGWIPLLSGLAICSVTIPFNTLITKRYKATQKLLMQVRDEKTGIVTEAMRGVRQIKFSAMESPWQEKIGEVRKRELALQWKIYVTQTLLTLTVRSGPLLLSTVSLSLYAYLHKELTPAVAFTTVGVFNSLQSAFGNLPQLIIALTAARVSVDRIEKYLQGEDKAENLTPGDSISFENASLAWPSDAKLEDITDRFVLRGVNLNFPNGELSVITGETGSGKSLLLSSILGECDLLDGVTRVPKPQPIEERYDNEANADNWILPSSIAFITQIPWLENATIKDNITFGLPFDPVRYKKTLSACALEKDIEMLTDGDMTEIGANGINLSGGQRWRVTLGRALYSRAGILVLDDIFSAVDAHVGRWIFENALTGELGQGRTRILATHHPALCISKTAYAIQLGDGKVRHAGRVDEMKKSGNLAHLLETDRGLEEENNLATVNEEEGQSPANATSALNQQNGDKNPKKFVEDEHREKGRIKTKVYFGYFRVSGGYILWSLCIVLFVVWQLIVLGRSWWVKIWTSSYEESSFRLFSDGPTYYVQHMSLGLDNSAATINESWSLSFYLTVYFLLGISGVLLASCRNLYLYSLAIRGSRELFIRMLATILRMPLRWIDTVPLGRILNRFTADFNVIDGAIAGDILRTMESGLRVVFVMIATSLASPLVTFLGLILLPIAVYYARFYLIGARDTKRLSSNSRSPVFEQLGSAMVGVSTIRAFDNVQVYIQRMYDLIDVVTVTHFYLFLCTRWLSFRLSMIGAWFTFAVAVVIVSTNGIDAALAGFALSFALEFAELISWTLRFYTNCELHMNSAERVLEYGGLTTESQDGIDVPAAWPSEGKIEVKDLVVRYADDLPPVLRGLNFSVGKSERIGIVGRTGAGKSSLALAFFRFLEAREGSITIDGIDISKIKLHDLRSRLAIIPQDPTLFSGTIRSNLDTFNQSTDNDLREVLQRVHLIQSATPSRDDTSNDITSNTESNINIFESLTSPISDGGLNLSQGQRQLLCLARAIIVRAKIMILDEATSAVDMDTDVLIQRSIREEFEGSTLLVIAHRLSTVADFDKILVMNDGKTEEFGTPRELLEKKEMFWTMVNQSGDREQLEQMILR